MSPIRKFPLVIRLISIVLIISFIAYDITWAYPDSIIRRPSQGADKLAPPSFFGDEKNIELAVVKSVEVLIEGNPSVPKSAILLSTIVHILEKNAEWLNKNNIKPTYGMDAEGEIYEILISFSEFALRYYDPKSEHIRKASAAVVAINPRLSKELLKVEALPYVETPALPKVDTTVELQGKDPNDRITVKIETLKEEDLGNAMSVHNETWKGKFEITLDQAKMMLSNNPGGHLIARDSVNGKIIGVIWSVSLYADSIEKIPGSLKSIINIKRKPGDNIWLHYATGSPKDYLGRGFGPQISRKLLESTGSLSKGMTRGTYSPMNGYGELDNKGKFKFKDSYSPAAYLLTCLRPAKEGQKDINYLDYSIGGRKTFREFLEYRDVNPTKFSWQDYLDYVKYSGVSIEDYITKTGRSLYSTAANMHVKNGARIVRIIEGGREGDIDAGGCALITIYPNPAERQPLPISIESEKPSVRPPSFGVGAAWWNELLGGSDGDDQGDQSAAGADELHQISKRGKVAGVIEKGGKKYLKVVDGKDESKVLGEIELTLKYKDGNQKLGSVLDDLIAEDKYGDVLEIFRKALDGRPGIEMYTFNTLIGDTFAWSSPEDHLIAIHEGLRDDPILSLRVIGEYLDKAKALSVKKGVNNVLEVNAVGRSKEIIITQERAISHLETDGDFNGNLFRALTAEMFAAADKMLSHKMREIILESHALDDDPAGKIELLCKASSYHREDGTYDRAKELLDEAYSLAYKNPGEASIRAELPYIMTGYINLVYKYVGLKDRNRDAEDNFVKVQAMYGEFYPDVSKLKDPEEGRKIRKIGDRIDRLRESLGKILKRTPTGKRLPKTPKGEAEISLKEAYLVLAGMNPADAGTAAAKLLRRCCIEGGKHLNLFGKNYKLAEDALNTAYQVLVDYPQIMGNIGQSEPFFNLYFDLSRALADESKDLPRITPDVINLLRTSGKSYIFQDRIDALIKILEMGEKFFIISKEFEALLSKAPDAEMKKIGRPELPTVLLSQEIEDEEIQTSSFIDLEGELLERYSKVEKVRRLDLDMRQMLARCGVDVKALKKYLANKQPSDFTEEATRDGLRELAFSVLRSNLLIETHHPIFKRDGPFSSDKIKAALNKLLRAAIEKELDGTQVVGIIQQIPPTFTNEDAVIRSVTSLKEKMPNPPKGSPAYQFEQLSSSPKTIKQLMESSGLAKSTVRDDINALIGLGLIVKIKVEGEEDRYNLAMDKMPELKYEKIRNEIYKYLSGRIIRWRIKTAERQGVKDQINIILKKYSGLIHEINVADGKLRLGGLAVSIAKGIVPSTKTVDGIQPPAEYLRIIKLRDRAIVCTEDRFERLSEELEGLKLERETRRYIFPNIEDRLLQKGGTINLSKKFFDYYKGAKSFVLIENLDRGYIELWPQEVGAEEKTADALKEFAIKCREEMKLIRRAVKSEDSGKIMTSVERMEQLEKTLFMEDPDLKFFENYMRDMMNNASPIKMFISPNSFSTVMILKLLDMHENALQELEKLADEGMLLRVKGAWVSSGVFDASLVINPARAKEEAGPGKGALSFIADPIIDLLRLSGIDVTQPVKLQGKEIYKSWKDLIEDFIAPPIEEGIMCGIGLYCGGIYSYMGIRLVFILLHAIQDRAPPGGRPRTFFEKITVPAGVSLAAIISILPFFAVTSPLLAYGATFILGTILHVYANRYLTLHPESRYQKAVVGGASGSDVLPYEGGDGVSPKGPSQTSPSEEFIEDEPGSRMIVEREGISWLNARLFEEVTGTILVGSARYLGTEDGLAPFDVLGDLDVAYFGKAQDDESRLNRLANDLKKWGVQKGKRKTINGKVWQQLIFSCGPKIVDIGYQASSTHFYRTAKSWIDKFSENLLNEGDLSVTEKVKRYLQVEYYYGDRGRYGNNLRRYIACRNNPVELEKLYLRLKDNEINLLVKDVDKLTDDDRSRRIMERLIQKSSISLAANLIKGLVSDNRDERIEAASRLKSLRERGLLFRDINPKAWAKDHGVLNVQKDPEWARRAVEEWEKFKLKFKNVSYEDMKKGIIEYCEEEGIPLTPGFNSPMDKAGLFDYLHDNVRLYVLNTLFGNPYLVINEDYRDIFDLPVFPSPPENENMFFDVAEWFASKEARAPPQGYRELNKEEFKSLSKIIDEILAPQRFVQPDLPLGLTDEKLSEPSPTRIWKPEPVDIPTILSNATRRLNEENSGWEFIMDFNKNDKIMNRIFELYIISYSKAGAHFIDDRKNVDKAFDMTFTDRVMGGFEEFKKYHARNNCILAHRNTDGEIDCFFMGRSTSNGVKINIVGCSNDNIEVKEMFKRASVKTLFYNTGLYVRRGGIPKMLSLPPPNAILGKIDNGQMPGNIINPRLAPFLLRHNEVELDADGVHFMLVGDEKKKKLALVGYPIIRNDMTALYGTHVQINTGFLLSQYYEDEMEKFRLHRIGSIKIYNHFSKLLRDKSDILANNLWINYTPEQLSNAVESEAAKNPTFFDKFLDAWRVQITKLRIIATVTEVANRAKLKKPDPEDIVETNRALDLFQASLYRLPDLFRKDPIAVSLMRLSIETKHENSGIDQSLNETPLESEKPKGSCADCLNSIVGDKALLEKALNEGFDIETDLKPARLKLKNPDQPFSGTTIHERELKPLIDLGMLIRLPDGKVKFSDMMMRPNNTGPPDKEYTINLAHAINEIEYPIGEKGPAKDKPMHRGEIPPEMRPAIKERIAAFVQSYLPREGTPQTSPSFKGDMEGIIQQAVVLNRTAIMGINKETANPFLHLNFTDPCGISQADLVNIIRFLTGNSKDVKILTHQGGDLFGNENIGHAFLIVSYKDKHYLVDTTLIQFFIKPSGEKEDIALEIMKKRRDGLTRQLLTYGYIELSDEVADMYGSVLRPKLSPDRTFRKVDLLVSSTLWIAEEYSNTNLAKKFGSLEERISRGKNSEAKTEVDKLVSKAADEVFTVSKNVAQENLETLSESASGLSPEGIVLGSDLKTPLKASKLQDASNQETRIKGMPSEKFDRSFIRGGIKNDPLWINNSFYKEFAPAGMGYTGALIIVIGSAVKSMKEYDLSVPRGGVGLSLGFGSMCSELVELKERFGLSVVHGVEWNADRVVSADKELRRLGLSPDEFILHHADMNNLSGEISDASIDFVLGVGITFSPHDKDVLTALFAKELLRVLRPGGIIAIHVDINANPVFRDTLAKEGNIFDNKPVVFQKTSGSRITETKPQPPAATAPVGQLSTVDTVTLSKSTPAPESSGPLSGSVSELSPDKLIESIHAVAKAGIKETLVPQGSEVLLSTSLFEEIDISHLEGLLKGANVRILDPKEIKRRATNIKVTKDRLAIVLTENDSKDLNIRDSTQINSSVLILKENLIGANYLYLEGVVNLAAAIMREDKPSIKALYQILTGSVLTDEVLDSLKYNAVAFAIKAMLKFKPIKIENINKLDEYKRSVEDLLTAA